MASRLGDDQVPSVEFHNPYCELCHMTKKSNVKALEYCPDCYQFLCADCIAFHSNLQGTKDHTTVSGDDMPKSIADKPPRYEYCADHPKERRDHFCMEHKSLICRLCTSVKHKGCSATSVDKACHNISSTEVNALYEVVLSFKRSLQSTIPSLDANKDKLEVEKKNMLKEAEAVYKNVIAMADKMYQEMKSEITSKYQSQVSSLSEYQRDIKVKIKILESSLNAISELKGKAIDTKVFLKVQRIISDVIKYNSNIQTLNQSLGEVSMVFVPSQKIQNFLSSPESIGSVSTTRAMPGVMLAVPDVWFPLSSMQNSSDDKQTGQMASSQITKLTLPLSEIKVSKRRVYNIWRKGDGRCCLITGMAVSHDGRRLLVDFNTSKVTVFSRDMQFLSSAKMKDNPRDIAVVSDQEAVVSMKNSLVMLDISGRNITIKNTQHLLFPVDCITKYKDKLIITSPTSPHSVKMIDQSGKVYWSISDQKALPLKRSPRYICSQDDGRSSTVIVTDKGANALTLLDGDTGNVITRRQVNGKGPRGVACDTNGNIYVCYWDTGEVAVLTGDLSEEKILMSKKDSLTGLPQAIVYDDTARELILSLAAGALSDTVNCFQLL